MITEISKDELGKLLKQGALLVDVREADELADGAIPGHVHMPLSDFPAYEAKMPRNQAVVFYCRSGRRSLKAASLAEQWTKMPLYSLKGGYLDYSGQE